MKIFNLPQRNGYQLPLIGMALGGYLGAGTAVGIAGGAMMGGMAGSYLGGANGMGGGGGFSAPPPRHYLGEMQDALKSQEAIQPDLLRLEGQYTPQYQALQQQTLMGQMGVLGGLYNQANPLSGALQAQFAGSQMPLYNAIGQMSKGAYQQGLGEQTMGLYDTMQRQAQAGLDAGYGLTPDMQRQAQQSARAAMTARGLAGGNQGIAQEVLNSYALGNQRYQQSLQNAQGAYGLGASQFASGMSNYGTPLMAQLAPLTSTSLIGTAGSMSNSLGTKIFQPESQYLAGVYGGNVANQMNTQMANAQAQAGWSSGMMGLAGSLGGAMLRNPNLFGGTPPPPAGNYAYQGAGAEYLSAPQFSGTGLMTGVTY